jgi:RNA polymerase sigma-70 factor (ECF subfamily)
MRPELIQASEMLRRGTPESVEEAVGLLQDTVFSFSMRVCGHREDAEDTMQDVLFGSLKHLAQLKEPEELAAWLYTVTRNRCRRMRRGHIANGRRITLEELIPDQDELQRLLLASENPENDFLRTEQQNHLHEAVLRLPPTLRLVLVLQDMEELESEEVARILGLQTGTVRVRLHRARLALRKEMARVLETLPHKPLATKKKPIRRPEECRAIFANLSEYLDRRLAPADCEQMRAHIEGCPACVAFIKDLRGVIERCRKTPSVCDPQVAKRLRRMMTQELLRLIGQQS